MSEANGDGIETVVVRPRFVWGAGDTTLLPEIAAAVEAGRFAWVGGGTTAPRSPTSTTSSRGSSLAAERGAGGEAYFVTDGDPVVFREFLSELLRAQGIEPPDRSVPAWVAGAIAAAAARRPGGRCRSGRLAPAHPLRALGGLEDCVLDDSKARSELGYAPVVSREQGLAEIARPAQPESSQTTIVPSTSTASIVIRGPAAPASESPDAQSAETPSRKPASNTRSRPPPTPGAPAPSACRSPRSRSASALDGERR